MQNITIRQPREGRMSSLGKTVSGVAEVSRCLGLAWNGACWFLTLTSTKLLKTQQVHPPVEAVQFHRKHVEQGNKRSITSSFKV
jgi:hypothetical protein